MGQEKLNKKLNVQKEGLKKIFVKMIATNIAIIEFQLTLTTKKEEIEGLKNIIKRSNRAIDIVNNIDHYEILISLYNAFINRKEPYFVSLVCTIDRKIINKWDKTEKGFQEFLEEENKAIEKTTEEELEKRKTAEYIQKARAEGKKVEMMYVDGKIKPVIVNEKEVC